MNLHVSLVRARPLHSPSWPLSERGGGGLLARRPVHSREGLGGCPVSLPSSPHPSWGSWQTWKRLPIPGDWAGGDEQEGEMGERPVESRPQTLLYSAT